MKKSYKILGASFVMLVAISMGAFYLKGSEVMGAFNINAPFAFPLLNVSQATDTIANAPGYTSILDFNLKPAGSISGENVYLKQLAFSLDAKNLVNNFSSLGSWKLMSGACNYGVESVSYSSSVLLLTLDGTSNCDSSLDPDSGSISLRDETPFSLQLKAEISLKKTVATMRAKVIDSVDNATAIWQWSDHDMWDTVTRDESTIYTIVNGEASKMSTL